MKIIFYIIRISCWVFFAGIILTIINFAFWKVPAIAAVIGLFAFFTAFIHEFAKRMNEMQAESDKWNKK